MESLEKVELVREKCGVSYEEARDALEASNYDVLDAIVAIERRGRIAEAAEGIVEAAQELVEEMAEVDEVDEVDEAPEPEVIEVAAEFVEPEPVVEEAAAPEPEAQPQPAEAAYSRVAEPIPETKAQAQERAARREARRSKVRAAWRSFCGELRNLLRSGIDMTFVAERSGECLFSLPVLFVVIGLLAWGATLWLMVIGLFFGLRYHIEGASPMTVDVNQVMDRAADIADDIKHDMA